MATGDKLVNLDELKLVYDKLHVPSVQVQIPTGQWSGSSTRTYTVNATNVTADTIVDWAMDSSINYLKADLIVTPGSGTIQFSTTAIPAGTINVTLFFPGVNGEVVIQTLADVYSKSQVDQKISQSTAWSNNWLTNTSILAYAASVATPSFTSFRTSATSTDVPIANEYYIGTVERYGQNITVKMTTMQDASKMYINNSVNGGSTWTGWKTFLDSQSTAVADGSASFTPGANISTDVLYIKRTGKLCVVRGNLRISGTVAGNNATIGTLPEGFRPSQSMYPRLWSTYNNTDGFFSFTVTPTGLIISGTGSNTFSGYIYLDMVFMTA